MMTSRRIVTTILLLWTGAIFAVSQQPKPITGSISGTVAYPDDSPAGGFVVVAVGTSKTSTPKTRGFTDKDGKFVIESLQLGEYVLSPYKEAENSGYPLALFRFYDKNPSRVRLSEESPQATTKIKLNNPTGMLMGKIVSASSGLGVRAQIELHRNDDPDANLAFASSEDGQYRAPIPSGVPIVIAVSAPGFKTISRTVTPDSTGGKTLLDIGLQPIR
jgi:hypothetical protein